MNNDDYIGIKILSKEESRNAMKKQAIREFKEKLNQNVLKEENLKKFKEKMKNIKFIAFNADDTLWESKIYYHEVKKQIAKLLNDYLSPKEVSKILAETEKRNIPLYDCGIRNFTFSAIEVASKVVGDKIDSATIRQIILMGKTMLQQPVKLLVNVKEVLSKLGKKYKLILVTKGDAFEQSKKLEKSGLIPYFDDVELYEGKEIIDYNTLLERLEIKPFEFVLVGNSLESDILPAIRTGANAIYIPNNIPWESNIIQKKPSEYYLELSGIEELEDVFLF